MFPNVKLWDRGNRVFLRKTTMVIHIVTMRIVPLLHDPTPFTETCVLTNVDI
jgi:hypothetical protein